MGTGVQDEAVGLIPFDHEVVTVADSAVGLTSATYDDATRAEMTLETAQQQQWDTEDKTCHQSKTKIKHHSQ